jgi:hypothetical protein
MQKKPVHRAFLLADALHALQEMEGTAAELQNSDVFQSFTSKEQAQYRDVLGRLRNLIHELELDTAQEQLAS